MAVKKKSLIVLSSHLGKLEFGQATVHPGMPWPQILPTHSLGHKRMLSFYHCWSHYHHVSREQVWADWGKHLEYENENIHLNPKWNIWITPCNLWEECSKCLIAHAISAKEKHIFREHFAIIQCKQSWKANLATRFLFSHVILEIHSGQPSHLAFTQQLLKSKSARYLCDNLECCYSIFHCHTVIHVGLLTCSRGYK